MRDNECCRNCNALPLKINWNYLSKQPQQATATVAQFTETVLQPWRHLQLRAISNVHVSLVTACKLQFEEFRAWVDTAQQQYQA